MSGDRAFFVSVAAVLAVVAPARVQQAQAQQAQTPSASGSPATQSDTADDNDEIVVRADADQVRIDRRVYMMRNDPIAQSTDMYEALGHIPSVSVSPSGAVTLLGANSPTVQINGQPLPQGANLEQVLRGLTGADVQRIEVITNPSAQYSSATSGGIINIITHQRYNSGFTGNASVMADTFGSERVNIAPNWSQGPWSVGGRVGYFNYQTHNDSTREHDDFASGVTTTDRSRNEIHNQDTSGSVQATYQPDRFNKATLSLDASSGNSDNTQSTNRADASGPVFHQDQDVTSSYIFDRLSLLMQHDGRRPREQVRLNAALTYSDDASDTTIAVTPATGPAPSPFVVSNGERSTEASVTLDYDLPLSGRQFVTVGLSADAEQPEMNNAQRTLSGPPGAGDFQSALQGADQTYAAYGTFQFGFSDWLFQPGLRLEDYVQSVSSDAVDVDSSDLRLFPTLHVRRSFSAIDVDLSYTSRINRPGIASLDPAVRFSDSTHASSGNPDLKPSTVDAYEANVTYQGQNSLYSVTLYDRLRHDIFSPFVSDVGGVTLTTTVNAGESEERGLQAMLRAPLGPLWRYSLTANVLDRSFDTLTGGSLQREGAVEYYGVASIEYRDRNQDADGADDIQLEVRFGGPRHTLQQETDSYSYAYLNWRRRLAGRLYSFVQIASPLSAISSRSLTRTDDFTERTVTESPGPRFRLTLTYQFGATADHAPPEPSESAGGAPH